MQWLLQMVLYITIYSKDAASETTNDFAERRNDPNLVQKNNYSNDDNFNATRKELPKIYILEQDYPETSETYPPFAVPEEKCGKNEKFMENPKICDEICQSTDDSMINCDLTKAGCFCLSGFVRDWKGDCIPAKNCPICDQNESYKSEPSNCPATCENPEAPEDCGLPPGLDGCTCKTGYVRNSKNICIEKEACLCDLCGENEECYSECAGNDEGTDDICQENDENDTDDIRQEDDENDQNYDGGVNQENDENNTDYICLENDENDENNSGDECQENDENYNGGVNEEIDEDDTDDICQEGDENDESDTDDICLKNYEDNISNIQQKNNENDEDNNENICQENDLNDTGNIFQQDEENDENNSDDECQESDDDENDSYQENYENGEINSRHISQANDESNSSDICEEIDESNSSDICEETDEIDESDICGETDEIDESNTCEENHEINESDTCEETDEIDESDICQETDESDDISDNCQENEECAENDTGDICNCICKPGYIRDTNQNCVPICGTNEKYVKNLPKYQATCEKPEENYEGYLEDEGCICLEGFVRDMIIGKCVREIHCPRCRGAHEKYVYFPADAVEIQDGVETEVKLEGGCVCDTMFYRNHYGDCIEYGRDV